MADYRIVFSDIDGTLVDSRHRLHPDTIEAVHSLDRKNIPFVLISSRPPQGMLPLQEELGIRAPLICFGGALVLDRERKPSRSLALNEQRAAAIWKFIRRAAPQICCCAYTADQWLADSLTDPWILQEQEISGAVPVPREHKQSGADCYKLLCMGEPEHILALEGELRRAFADLAVSRSKDSYLELTDSSCSKSEAVRYLCGELNIPVEQAVAFGDNFNDVDMLQAVGLGVTMGNAPVEIKRAARRLAPDNDSQGVAHTLRELFG